jgi:hypothetical protein
MFTIVSVTNPVYNNAEGTHIDCSVKFAEFNEVHPFGANEWDPEPHGQELFADLKAGKYGPIAPYVPPVTKSANNQPVSSGTQNV